MTDQSIVLVLGSGPNVVQAAAWPRAPFDRVVAINNAWAVRTDWDDLVFPEDFDPARLPPTTTPNQRLIKADAFVPAQNHYGGFVLSGGTMAFTAAYWALHDLNPKVLAFLGCDMVYPNDKPTHFYGTGTADPLRDDLSLRDLEAKSARLALIAAAQGCACVNLSQAEESRLVFARSTPHDVSGTQVLPRFDRPAYDALRRHEETLGYGTPTGRYWEEPARFDTDVLAALDGAWRSLFDRSS